MTDKLIALNESLIQYHSLLIYQLIILSESQEHN